MIRTTSALALLIVGAPAVALGQEVAVQETESQEAPTGTAQPAPTPIQVYRRDEQPGLAELPANTEIIVSLNQEVTTKGNTWSEGDKFDMTVEEDVMLGEYIVIPRGTRAVGTITWMTDKGMFGKSGKFDIEMDYIELGGRRLPINGTYRQEGEGNTLATVGGVVLVPISGFFITGKSGAMPAGRELKAYTEEAIPVAIEASAITPPKRVELAQPAGITSVNATGTAAEDDPADE
ncbi:hypothetical protein I5L01_09230 [Erythrobacter sp. YJ-T3-07]|uniref:hypothetical protein n=1 Tax=Erythrobacter sp. YJ-T3-07 TaxID=2793063 RepID=UPI0018D28A97|nr:hypothetical protein [Erythrobacter sp. YJ-T3-07]MBH1944414.1 hypothetical protein [Erythrobacter sp. YJ-T3-07]